MKKNIILIILHVLVWLIFVGLGIETGRFLTQLGFAILKPETVPLLWIDANFLAIFKQDKSQFITLVALISVVGLLKCILFYLIIMLLSNKDITLKQPFTMVVMVFLRRVSLITFLIGAFAYMGGEFAKRLQLLYNIPINKEEISLSGADVWLFMSVTLFIVTEVFKKGIALQSENDLTV